MKSIVVGDSQLVSISERRFVAAEVMALWDQTKKEPCKKEACDIQSCLTKNNFLSQRCEKVIRALQSCCEQCENKSTHCASVSGLLKQIAK